MSLPSCFPAEIQHIPAMHVLRMSVKENALSNPLLVTENDYTEMLNERGKGWICIRENALLGFAIVDLKDHNIWALFVAPGAEKQGVGRLLHDTMLDWSFEQSPETLWLATAPDTRAEQFYRKAGWHETARTKHGEIRFEMHKNDWNTTQKTT